MGIATGVNKGNATTKLKKREKPVNKKGRLSRKTKLVREIVREVAGLAPYEKRVLDMIKVGGSSAEKRMYKFAKRKLGGHKRALSKRDEIKAIYAKQRSRAAMTS